MKFLPEECLDEAAGQGKETIAPGRQKCRGSLINGVKPGSLNRWDRYHIIPQLAVYTTYIPLIYCLYWVIIYHLPFIKGTRNSYWPEAFGGPRNATTFKGTFGNRDTGDTDTMGTCNLHYPYIGGVLNLHLSWFWGPRELIPGSYEIFQFATGFLRTAIVPTNFNVCFITLMHNIMIRQWIPRPNSRDIESDAKPLSDSIKTWMGPNPNGPLSGSCETELLDTQVFSGSVDIGSCKAPRFCCGVLAVKLLKSALWKNQRGDWSSAIFWRGRETWNNYPGSQ